MRLICFVVIFSVAVIDAPESRGQIFNSKNHQQKLNAQQSIKYISLREALSNIEHTYQINIVFEQALLQNKIIPDNIKISNNLHEDLMRILGRHSLTYELVGIRTIVIIPQIQKNKGIIKGKVINRYDEGLPVAQVVIKGTTLGAVSNLEGEYSIMNVPPGTYTIQTQVIGYRQQSVVIHLNSGEIVHHDFSLVQDVIKLDEVVITASRNPLIKRESSVAITTKTLDQIIEIIPRNTTDLLRVVPGFYVESSGGEVGGNLFARGLPADGSFYYVALMEDGMPVFSVPSLSFVNADIFIRIDENIERIEAVRGGNSALFGSNAPGGVINFISKAGGSQLSSTSKITLGTDDLARYDFNLNGPLSDKLRFNIGGFYRYDKGVRNAGFRASKGGQIKANFTHLFSNGYIKIYGKYLNDSNIFYLPLPFKAGKNLDFVDGFPHNGTLTTLEGDMIKVPTPNNGYFTMPLEDGQKQAGGSLMIEFHIELPRGWAFQNKTRYMNIKHSWNALVPFDLVNAHDWAQSYVNNTQAATHYDIFYTNHYNEDSSNAVFNTSNSLLSQAGLWHVTKPLSDISNELVIKKSLKVNQIEHNFSIGTYQCYYTADDFWYWQNILTDVRNAPRFVDVNLKDANGNVIREVTKNGFLQYGSMYMNAKGDVAALSLFFDDNVKFSEKLRMDIGARLEYNSIHQQTENTQAYDLGQSSDADDNVQWGNGTFKYSKVKYKDWAASFGVNYSLSFHLSVYSRICRGYKMPTLDVFRGADGAFKPDAEKLWQGETGLKYGTSSFGVNATIYFMQLENFPSQDARIVNDQTVWVTDYVGKSETIGLEMETIVVPLKNFKCEFMLTLQDHKYKNFMANHQNYKGNWIQRIPKIFSEIALSGLFRGFKIRANYNYIGKRYSNNANSIELPWFDVTNLSLSRNIEINKTQKLTLALNVLNVFNGKGLTEGNPRLDNSGANLGTFYLARPILPRRLQLSTTYNF